MINAHLRVFSIFHSITWLYTIGCRLIWFHFFLICRVWLTFSICLPFGFVPSYTGIQLQLSCFHCPSFDVSSIECRFSYHFVDYFSPLLFDVGFYFFYIFLILFWIFDSFSGRLRETLKNGMAGPLEPKQNKTVIAVIWMKIRWWCVYNVAEGVMKCFRVDRNDRNGWLRHDGHWSLFLFLFWNFHRQIQKPSQKSSIRRMDSLCNRQQGGGQIGHWTFVILLLLPLILNSVWNRFFLPQCQV